MHFRLRTDVYGVWLVDTRSATRCQCRRAGGQEGDGDTRRSHWDYDTRMSRTLTERIGAVSSSDATVADGSSVDQGLDAPPTDSQSAQDGASCGTLANTASPVAATEIAALPSVAKGGPLTDGIYELVAAEETLSSAPAKFWRTSRSATREWPSRGSSKTSAFHRITAGSCRSWGRAYGERPL